MDENNCISNLKKLGNILKIISFSIAILSIILVVPFVSWLFSSIGKNQISLIIAIISVLLIFIGFPVYLSFNEKDKYEELKNAFKFIVFNASIAWFAGLSFASLGTALYFSFPNNNLTKSKIIPEKLKPKDYNNILKKISDENDKIYFKKLYNLDTEKKIYIKKLYNSIEEIAKAFLILVFNGIVLPDKNTVYNLMGIYFSCIALPLTIRIFYKKTAPIININELLYEITQDFDKLHKNANKKVWIIYPALNIGHFREAKNYNMFREKLICGSLNDIEINTVTYDPNLYKPMYNAYNSQNKSKDPADIVHKSYTEATDLIRILAAHNKSTNFILPPENFPSQIIIIGNIVYTIISFGLPVYKANNESKDEGQNGKFESTPNGRNNLAKLIAYRREDNELSDLLNTNIEYYLNNQNNCKIYVSNSETRIPIYIDSSLYNKIEDDVTKKYFKEINNNYKLNFKNLENYDKSKIAEVFNNYFNNKSK